MQDPLHFISRHVYVHVSKGLLAVHFTLFCMSNTMYLEFSPCKPGESKSQVDSGAKRREKKRNGNTTTKTA